MRQLRDPVPRERSRPDRWPLIDRLVALVYAVPAALVLANEADGVGGLLLAAVVLVVLVMSMAGRRDWPVTAVLAQLVAVAVLGLAEPRALSVALAALGYSLYVAAAARPPVAVALLAAALLAATATALPDFQHAAGAVLFGGGYLLVWCTGFWVVTQRRHTAALLGNQARLAEAELARAQGALAEERLRIARDLHDVVAHTITVITVQAGFGRLAADTDPAQAKQALGTIETAGREALEEMRQLLQVLRASGEGSLRDHGPELAPAPGLADLDHLVERTAAAGLRLEVRVVGVPEALAPAVDTSAYRLIQEAVTNVVKHADVAAATVRLRYDDGWLEIEIRDQGSGGRDRAGPGYGLVGLRERMHLHGGTFAAEPLPDKGFRVRGRLPVHSTAASPDGSALVEPVP